MLCSWALLPLLLLLPSSGQAYHVNLRKEARENRDDPRLKDVIQDENMEHWLKFGRDEIDFTLTRMTRNTRVAKNIVLFVGDGMSIPTITATRIYKEQVLNGNFESPEKASLTYDRFPHMGHSKTYSVDEQTPDSASTASAMFSGVKTRSWTLGYDSSIMPEDPGSMLTAKEVETVLTWAQKAGKKTGFVTTARVSHATPGALYAHNCDRYWECDWQVPNNLTAPEGTHDIAWQLVRREPGNATNVIFGGGLSAFIPKENQSDYEGLVPAHGEKWNCYRNDSDNLYEAWKADHPGSETVHNLPQLLALDDNTEFVLGLFSEYHVAYEDERDTELDPSIVNMTSKAVQLLLNNDGKGFFLMVESGRIDHAHHDTKAVRALNEAMLMDLAVEETIRRLEAAGQLDDTLIIVTADHSHTMSINGYPARGNDIRGLSNKFYEDGLPFTTLSYANGQGYYTHNIVNETGNGVTRFNLSQLSEEEIKDFDFIQASAGYEEAGDETHGGDDVAIFAMGPMAHLFHTTHEQTHIAFVMAYSACIGPYAGDDKCEGDRGHGGHVTGSGLANMPLALVVATLAVWALVAGRSRQL